MLDQEAELVVEVLGVAEGQGEALVLHRLSQDNRLFIEMLAV